LVQGLEHVDARLQERAIVRLCAAKAFNEPANGRGFGLVVLGFFEIEVVHDSTDVTDGRVGNVESVAERLECAVAAAVTELQRTPEQRLPATTTWIRASP
jgi:hypothetical protein